MSEIVPPLDPPDLLERVRRATPHLDAQLVRVGQKIKSHREMLESRYGPVLSERLRRLDDALAVFAASGRNPHMYVRLDWQTFDRLIAYLVAPDGVETEDALKQFPPDDPIADLVAVERERHEVHDQMEAIRERRAACPCSVVVDQADACYRKNHPAPCMGCQQRQSYTEMLRTLQQRAMRLSKKSRTLLGM